MERIGEQKMGLGTDRERLLDEVFAARTLGEIAVAKQALRGWLTAHPDEAGMADALEVLSYQEAHERAREARSDASTKPAPVT
jgi:hypothetical protein